MSAPALAHPEWLGALTAIAAAAALALATARRLARRRSRRLLGVAAPSASGPFRSDAVLWGALVAIGLALLGPQIGERTLRIAANGVDVVFLIDVSRSMDARDVPPSRLQRGRRMVSDLIARLAPGDRAALAAFAGRGRLLTPLTPDSAALSDLVAEIASGIIRPASSRVDLGVRAALAAFEAGSSRPRVLFVVSDGEDPRGRRDLASDAARRAGVRVVTAAVGSAAGSFVPDGGQPLRLRSGSPVATRRDAERLATLAAATGGEAFVADEWGRIDDAAAIAAIRRDVGGGGEAVERRVAAVRTAACAALAFALLLLEGLPRRRGRRAARVAATGVALALAAAFIAALVVSPVHGAGPAPPPDPGALAAAEARVRNAPEDPRAQLALGLARLEHGRGEAAARAFMAAAVHAVDPDLGALARYDLGVARLEQGELEAAREAFFDALSLDPSDTAARFNLEWTLAALRRRTPEADASDGAGPVPPTAARPPAPARESSPAPAATVPPPPDAEDSDGMSPDSRRRLLARIADDPRRWLRAGPGGPADTGERSAPAPVW